jgi:K+-transporting ATPase KdpF subunit
MYSELLMDIHLTDTPIGYTLGVLIAILILAYLLYSLIKPEKF